MSTKNRPTAPQSKRYSAEEKERAVRMVRQLRKEFGTSRGTVRRVAEQIGVGTESLRVRFKQAEIDAGVEPGVTSEQDARIKVIEQENCKPRRDNDLLRRATAFVAGKLDRPSR